MSEMIERVARVLYDERMRIWKSAAPASLPEPEPTWETDNEPYRDQLRHEARLAIAAMREPTDAMDRSGVRAEDFRSLDLQKVHLVWHAMIDAALRDDS